MIIFLNGASSSGKTTIARSIQHISNTKFLLLGIDTFIKMMPVGMLGFSEAAKEGFFLEQHGIDLEPRVKILPGAFAEKLSFAAASMTKELADLKFDLIVDEVLLEKKYLDKYVSELKNHSVYFVKVFCDLKILSEREILRGNRSWGMAREQFFSVHQEDYEYDLEIDNSSGSCFDHAQIILNFIQNNQKPKGFQSMLKKIEAY